MTRGKKTPPTHDWFSAHYSFTFRALLTNDEFQTKVTAR